MVETLLAVSSSIWYYGSALVLGVMASVLAARWPAWPPDKRRRASIFATAVLAVALITPVATTVAVTSIERQRGTTIQVTFLVKVGDQPWGRQAFAEPGQVVQYQLEVTNVGPGSAENLIVGANMANYMRWVPHSTHIVTSGARPVDDVKGNVDYEPGAVIDGGLTIGDYRPGRTAVVEWAMKLDDRNVYEKLDVYSLTSVGIGRVPEKTNEFYNVATVDVRI